MSETVIRRIHADEWAEVRALRLASVNDPDAGIAFLETPETVSARDESFWAERTLRAARSRVTAQFVAVADDAWVGSLTVIVRGPGAVDHLGRTVETRRGDVVGVYVAPEHRGDGTVDRLFAAGSAWAAHAGVRTMSLDVHADNARAQGAYRRAGFAPTGERFDGPIGPEIVMTRSLGIVPS